MKFTEFKTGPARNVFAGIGRRLGRNSDEGLFLRTSAQRDHRSQRSRYRSLRRRRPPLRGKVFQRGIQAAFGNLCARGFGPPRRMIDSKA